MRKTAIVRPRGQPNDRTSAMEPASCGISWSSTAAAASHPSEPLTWKAPATTIPSTKP